MKPQLPPRNPPPQQAPPQPDKKRLHMELAITIGRTGNKREWDIALIKFDPDGKRTTLDQITCGPLQAKGKVQSLTAVVERWMSFPNDTKLPGESKR